MPGIMACRNLAAARSSSSSGNMNMKQPAEDLPVAIPRKLLGKPGKLEKGFFAMEQLPQLHFQPKNNQDLARRRLFGHGDFNAADANPHDLSSGSEHEPSSVCLAAMVDEFMEDQATLDKCTGIGKPSRGDRSSDDCAMNLGGELLEILKGFIACESDTERTLLSDVSKALDLVKDQASLICKQDGADCTNGCLKRAAMKHLRGGGYNAAICKSRWDRAGSFPGGDYEYIDVLLEEGKQRLIVDVDFREQFVIARPTERYCAILEEVPQVFVGKPERLQQVVNVMSDAVKQSLKKKGMHLPPWRKPDYLRAKWFSAYRRTTNDSHAHELSEEIVSRALSHTAIRGSRLDTRFTNEIEKVGFRTTSNEIEVVGFRTSNEEAGFSDRRMEQAGPSHNSNNNNSSNSVDEKQKLQQRRQEQQQEQQTMIVSRQQQQLLKAVKTARDEIIVAMSSDWEPPEISNCRKPVRLTSMLCGAGLSSTLARQRQQQQQQELSKSGSNLVVAAV